MKNRKNMLLNYWNKIRTVRQNRAKQNITTHSKTHTVTNITVMIPSYTSETPLNQTHNEMTPYSNVELVNRV